MLVGTWDHSKRVRDKFCNWDNIVSNLGIGKQEKFFRLEYSRNGIQPWGYYPILLWTMAWNLRKCQMKIVISTIIELSKLHQNLLKKLPEALFFAFGFWNYEKIWWSLSDKQYFIEIPPLGLMDNVVLWYLGTTKKRLRTTGPDQFVFGCRRQCIFLSSECQGHSCANITYIYVFSTAWMSTVVILIFVPSRKKVL